MNCALENSEMHVVIIRDRSTRSAIFALDGNLLVVIVLGVSRSPDTTTKAPSYAAILEVRL